MALSLDPGAPGWARTLVSQIDKVLLRITGRSDKPFRLPQFAVADLPDPAKWPWCLIAVTDGTGNKRLAISNGTVWKFPDGNTVS